MKLSTQEGRSWLKEWRAHILPRGGSFVPSRFYQVVIVLLVAWIARYLFAVYMPPDARSADTFAWEAVIRALNAGENPYKTTPWLVWPPVWMQLLYLISHVSTALHVPFMHVLQFFLAFFESLVIVALFQLIWEISPQARAFVPMLAGYSLNPTAIFLTCQHGNFDVLVSLWALLFTGQIVRHQRSRNEVDWLAACLWVGLGIVTKTVPLVLCPMLAGGWRRVAWRTRLIGAALVFGPVTLGMSIIYVLAPTEVAAEVIGYRSGPGYFGISGLLVLAHWDFAVGFSRLFFYVLLGAGEALVAWVFWDRERLESRGIILCAAMILASIPGIGPGYSPQYLAWIMPLLIATYVLYDGFWRRVLQVFWLVCALTCAVEYGIIPSHGMYLYYWVGELSDKTVYWLNWWALPKGQIVMRLPLFATFLVLLAAGIRLLVREFRSDHPAQAIGDAPEALPTAK